MLQGPRARGGAGRGLAECGEARVCGGAGRGLAGWGGDSGPSAGCAGIRAPARGGMGFGPRVRGGVGIQARRGVEWGFGPRRGVWWGFRPRTQGVRGFRPERGVGIFWGKMGNFLPFCRFFAVWVEISGQWNLESLPFSGKNGCLGRDFRTAELGISTFFQQKPLFR